MRRVGLIGGTGFGEALAPGEQERVETEYGPASIMRSALDVNSELIFVARHGAGHKIAPHQINHRANIEALRQAGVSAVFATTAVGSLKEDMRPGDFVILDDLIDLTKGEVVTFFDKPGVVRHTDMSAPYAPALRRILMETADDTGRATVHLGGTYVCVSGPRYETRAEIRLFASWGGSVVGMTGAPEVILCCEAGLPYAGVSIVTNYGCGLVENTPLSHAEVEEQMAGSRDRLAAWLLRAARSSA